MGKNKNKNEQAPNPTSVANRDILQRLNFLYQASVLLNGLAPPDAVDRDDTPLLTPSAHNAGTAEEPPPRTSRVKQKQKKSRRAVGLGELSRSYVETMKSVGRKTNVRMDPSVKRCICTRCCAPLVPGVSATVRVKGSASHGHLVACRCRRCGTERRIPAPPVLRTDLPTGENATEARGGMQEDAPSLAPPPAAGASTGNVVRAGPRRRQRRRKRGPQSRLPPHFARDVGHVVFCGNELLDAAPDVP